MKYNTRKKIAVFFLAAFLLSNFIVFDNLHMHRLADGHFVVHGHPFNKKEHGPSPDADGRHSAAELLFYFAVMAVEGIVLLFLAFWFFVIRYAIIRYYSDFPPQSFFFILPSLRAPPILF